MDLGTKITNISDQTPSTLEKENPRNTGSFYKGLPVSGGNNAK